MVGHRWGEGCGEIEAMWVGEKDYTNAIGHTWKDREESSTIMNLMQLISKCGEKLQIWNKVNFENVEVSLSNAKSRLKKS